jgi:hypothetical protein
VLRSVFGAEFQYSQPQGSQNRIGLERYQSDFQRREALRQALDAKRAQVEVVGRDLIALNQKLATLEADLAAAGPVNAANPLNLTAQADIAKAKADIAARTSERELLNAEITQLSTEERALTLATPTLSAPTPGSFTALPDDLTGMLAKSMDKIGSPGVNASTALDNFVQMQYEVIAKQLTLLRDEVGPNERLVFLELPASVYSVPGKDENYIAQIKWRVSQIAKLGTLEAQDEAIPPLTLEAVQAMRVMPPAGTPQSPGARRLQEFLSKMKQETQSPSDFGWFKLPDDEERNPSESSQTGPEPPAAVMSLGAGRETLVRALDVIPRQSALNVNDHHATQNGFNLMALFQLLTGVGAKVSYQRQRTIYEQFVHQEIFASGFGKGQATFGWTFGPLPGTNRLAPGVRTTYAVVAIPRTAVAVRLTASSRVYKRNQHPSQAMVSTKDFDVLVPGEWTDGFWIRGVSYTPVVRGQRAVIQLDGEQFSPQLGVLINGVPLRRAVSIGRNESDRVSSATGVNGIDGEYEYLGSESVVLSFSMGDKYVGTPTITLVTPGKTSSINAFRLRVNYTGPMTRLRDIAHTEPMFIEPLELKKVVALPNAAGGQPRIRLIGTGFRPDAHITLNHVAPMASAQTSTEAYDLTLAAPLGPKTLVRLEQPTRQGVEIRELTHQPPQSSASAKVIEFQPLSGPQVVRVAMELSLPGAGTPSIGASSDYTVESVVDLGNDVFLVRLRATRYDFLLTATRGAATSLHRVIVPAPPSISDVRNLRTGEPSATADQEVEVRVTGRHLRNVKRVIFGSASATLIAYGATSDVLIVRAPALSAGRVQVTLETDLEYQGIPVSNAGDFASGATNAYFTYVKK